MQLVLWTAAQCKNSLTGNFLLAVQVRLVWGGSPCNVKARGGADLSCFLICHMERCLLAAITNVLFLEQSRFLASFFHVLLNRRPSADLPSLSRKRSSGTVYTGFFLCPPGESGTASRGDPQLDPWPRQSPRCLDGHWWPGVFSRMTKQR